MIQVFIGNDGFSRQRALDQAIAKALGDRANDPLSKQVFHAGESGDELSDRVIESCSTVSMFGPELAVIVRRIEALKAADQERLIKWLLTKPECLLFMEGEKVDGRTEFGKQIKKLAKVESFEAPPAYKMAEWISNHCQSTFQCKIHPTAAQYVSDALGNDPSLVHTEIEKIRLHSPDSKEITLDQVRLLIVPQREMAAFEIQKSFGDRDVVNYVRTLRQLLHQGVDGIPMVSSLYQQCVRMIHVQAMTKQGKSETEMAQACGMMPWVFSKVQNVPKQASKWPTPLLYKVAARLNEMSFELKVGKYSTPAEVENALYALLVR